MKSLSLKIRLSLAVATGFILLAVGETFFAFQYFEAAYKKSVSHDLMLMGATLADNIDSRLQMSQSALAAAKAALPPELLADPPLAQKFLNERVTLQAIFPRGILLISAEGRLIAQYPSRPGEPRRDFSDREFFSATMALKVPSFFTITGPAGEDSEVVVAIPFVNPDGDVHGVMAGMIDVALSKASIEKLLREKVGSGTHIYIASRGATYLLHQGASAHGNKIPPSQIPLFEKALAGAEAAGEVRDCDETEVVAAFEKLTRIDSVLMVSWPLSLAYAPLEKAKDFFLGAIIIEMLVLMAIAWFFTARVVEPLQIMTRHVRSLPKLLPADRLLHLDRDDEVGILAEAFDELMTTLESRQTELVRLNDILQQRATELAVKNRELESFSYSLSHDLKTPLTSITLSAEVLKDTISNGFSPNAAFLLSTILAESDRMSSLIDAMLILSRLSRAEVRYEQVNLSALAREMLLRLSEGNPDRKAEWKIAPDVIVSGDARLLQSVLENLLGNAWKYSGKKDVARIEFGVQGEEDQVFFVRDNGAGFDVAEAEHIFEPFQRFHDNATFTGFGIGLATVQRIIQRHGGRIWAESEPDKGATFFFTLRPDKSQPNEV